MALRKTIESVRGIFTLKEYIYDSGLVEISLFVAEVMEGAGPVLRGVISKQDVGDNWVGCTSRRSGVSIGRRKETVIVTTISEIERDMRNDGSMRFYEKREVLA